VTRKARVILLSPLTEGKSQINKSGKDPNVGPFPEQEKSTTGDIKITGKSFSSYQEEEGKGNKVHRRGEVFSAK